MAKTKIPKTKTAKSHNERWVILGVVLLAVFVIINIPAIWGGYLLTRGTGLALSGVTGSLWNGRASLASFSQNDKNISLGQLSWRLQPLSLISLSPCAHVKTGYDEQEFAGEICVSLNGGIKIQDAQASFPVTLLQSQIPVPIQGMLMMKIESLKLKGDVLTQLKAKADWMGARINNGANWLDIGNYSADLKDNGSNGVRAQLVELAGPIDVDLQIELTAPSGGKVSGELAGDKGFFESAKAMDVLAMFASEDKTDEQGKTHYRVDMNL
jgi:general secretion pathway protein N